MRTFDKTRVAVVDSINKNLLIRGPIPINKNGQFTYNGIADCLKIDLNKKQFLNISLIDCVGELDMLSKELSAFGLDKNLYEPSYWPPYLQTGYDSKKKLGFQVKNENGQHNEGSMIWWPIEGIGPNQTPKEFLIWPGWNFSGLVNYVTNLMNEPESNYAIYVHCTLGADRTGAVVAGYLMKKNGWSSDQAIEIVSKQTSAGSPNSDYLSLIKEYEKLKI